MCFLNFEFRLMVVKFSFKDSHFRVSNFHYTPFNRSVIFLEIFHFKKKHIQSVPRLLEGCLAFNLIIFKDTLIFFNFMRVSYCVYFQDKTVVQLNGIMRTNDYFTQHYLSRYT